MTVVVDATVVVATLVDDGPDGRWAEEILLSDDLAALGQRLDPPRGSPRTPAPRRDWTTTRSYSTTDLYEMDAVSGTWSLLYTLPYLVVDLAISEDGAEIVIVRLLRDEHWRREWQGSVNEEEPAIVWTYQDAACTVEWRSYATGNVLAVAPFEKTCATEYAHIQNEVFQNSRDPVLGSLSP